MGEKILSASVEQRDRGQDQEYADGFAETEGDGEEQRGEEDRGQRLDGAHDADDARLDVFETFQIRPEGDDRAEKNDVNEHRDRSAIQDADEAPWCAEGCEQEAAEEHRPADDERRAEVVQEPFRLDRIDGGTKGGSDAPEKSDGRDGESRKAAVSHDEEGADEGKQHAAGFMKRRKAAALQGEPEDDDDRHQVLQDARRCRVAVLEGRKICLLHAEHA